MKKNRLCILLVLWLLCLHPLQVLSAADGTTYTYTISVDGNWIRTQDAYLPGQVYLQGAGLKKPADLFVKGNQIYIADSDNGRIVIFEPENETLQSFGEGILKTPKGIFVSDDTIYVADYGAECVFIFNSSLELVQKIERPDSYLFSELSRYKPLNVVVSSGGTIYVVGEGSYEGIMQFNPRGEFQGYFAANTASMSLLEKVQELIFTEEQKNRLFTRTPRAIQNIDIDERDLLLSVTQDAGVSYSWRAAKRSEDNNVKLHNFSGNDILDKSKTMVQEWNFIDIAAGNHENCYALTYTGIINEYDSEGNLVFSFGGRAVSGEKNGLFTYAAAIDVDEQGFLYILDSEKGIIQTYYPTEFAVTTHKAIDQLSKGNYVESEETFAGLLKLNGVSRIAHNGYGKALFYQQRFDEALDHFYIANNKAFYSESFWEIRDAWLNRNMGFIIAGFFIAFILLKAGKKLKQKYIPKKSLNKDSIFYQLKTMLRHPIDSFYYIKRGERGSILSATIFYVIAFLIFLWDRLFTGFIFNNGNARESSVFFIAAMFYIPCALWVIGNYLVSSINEGEGKLRSVYIGTAYAMAPYILIMPFVLLSTYILTLNEAFIIDFSWIFCIAWSGIILFTGVMEIHNYPVKEAIKNVLITLFFMIMAVIVAAILYLVWDQVIAFAKNVGGEVMYRGSR